MDSNMKTEGRGAAREGATASWWREPAFRAVWVGQTVSLFGDQVTGLALPWLILLQTQSAFDAGVISAVRYVPIVLLALPAGVIADRADRRALMIGADVVRMGALGSVAVMGILGRSPALWLLAVVVAVLGVGQLLFQVAYHAWLPEVTGDERLSRATAALEAADAASVLAGYPLAGALIALVGAVTALGVDALSYLTSAVTLLSVRALPARRSEAPRKAGGRIAHGERGGWPRVVRTLRRETVDGLHAAVATPTQRLLRGMGAALYALAGGIVVLVAALTQLRLHLPAWQAGFVFAAMGAGGLVGSALAPRLYHWGWRRGLAVAFSAATMGLLLLASACLLSPGWGFAVALLANGVTDGCASLGFVLIGTTTTLVTAPEVRGRVNAAVAIYSSLVRAVAVVALGALTSASPDGNPLLAFVVLAMCCLAAALVAARRPGTRQ